MKYQQIRHILVVWGFLTTVIECSGVMNQLQRYREYLKSEVRDPVIPELELLPKYYASVCLNEQQEVLQTCNYTTYKVQINDGSKYKKLQKLGEGGFAQVHLGIDEETQQKVVIKYLNSPSMMKLRREVMILNILQGQMNTAKLIEVIEDPENGQYALIFDYFEQDISLSKYAKNITDYELKIFMYQILKALDFANSFGIIHKDLKPGNVLINTQKKELVVIDWGISDFYYPYKFFQLNATTYPFMSPELIMDHKYLQYSFDIWSLGAMFADLLLRGKGALFFSKEKNKYVILDNIVNYLGTDDLKEYVSKFKMTLNRQVLVILDEKRPKVDWKDYITENNKDILTDEAIELLEALLTYDHTKRVSAKDAMQFPYFDEVREQEHHHHHHHKI